MLLDTEVKVENIQELLGELSLDDLVTVTWEMLKPHYKKKPVTIEHFINDQQYLGKYFKGNRAFFPFWMEKLKTIYPTEFHSSSYELIWDLPIGSGKTLTATVILLYEIYKLQCLKNPHEYYGLADGIRIVFTIFSASLSLSTDVNWEYFEAFLTTSPYFINNCPLPEGGKLKSKDSVVFPGNICIDLGSMSTHALGKAVFGGMLDEANFQRVHSQQAKEGYLAIKRRRESRFMGVGGEVPGKLILLSSPRFSTDFLAEQKKTSRGVSSVFILENVPIWEVRKDSEKDIYSGKTFQIFIGSATHDPFIIEDGSPPIPDVSKVEEVPVEYLEAFRSDLKSSLRDIRGLDVQGASAFITSPQKFNLICTMKHRFHKEVVVLDFFDVQDTVWRYSDKDYFSRFPFPESYRFIHIDLAKNHDRAAAASIFACSDTETLGPDNRDAAKQGDVVKKRERMYYCEWLLYLSAKPGQEIPFFKIREFIVYLKKQGYPILKVSADQYQSADMLQQLKLSGIQTENVSVDKTRLPYMAIRELIYRGKILLPRVTLMMNEFLELQDDTEVIDHPSNGSKDGSDAVTGALWNAITSETILSPAARYPKDISQQVPKKVEGMLAEAQRRDQLNELARRMFVQPGLRR